ncbi:CLUMA_CG013909, isoform A [Clunio marinus]|uniref:CLUMA_CG013909, isoform A n=1 Tax=Clunio marinus TaxID=568069 RepID=A0A1J1IQ70_9DIPT|nr:CLUMA_CG013909, isoform A [Clunio marinus]
MTRRGKEKDEIQKNVELYAKCSIPSRKAKTPISSIVTKRKSFFPKAFDGGKKLVFLQSHVKVERTLAASANLCAMCLFSIWD